MSSGGDHVGTGLETEFVAASGIGPSSRDDIAAAQRLHYCSRDGAGGRHSWADTGASETLTVPVTVPGACRLAGCRNLPP